MKMKFLLPLLPLLLTTPLATAAADSWKHHDGPRWGAPHHDSGRSHKTVRYINGCKIVEKYGRKGYRKKVKCKRPHHWRHGYGHGHTHDRVAEWDRDRDDDWRDDGQRDDNSRRDDDITVWPNPDTAPRTAPDIVAGSGPCREVITTATIAGRQQQLYGQACRQPDGAWKFVDE